MTLYVCGLPIDTTDTELHNMFSEHGQVIAIRVPRDPETHKPRGFAFVDMTREEDAARAIAALNGAHMGKRKLQCREAHARTDRSAYVGKD